MHKTLFPEGIYYDAEKHDYRTSKINELLSATICLSNNCMEKENGNFQENLENSRSVTRSRIERSESERGGWNAARQSWQIRQRWHVHKREPSGIETCDAPGKGCPLYCSLTLTTFAEVIWPSVSYCTSRMYRIRSWTSRVSMILREQAA